MAKDEEVEWRRMRRLNQVSIGGATLPTMRKIYRGIVQPATNFASSV